MITEKGTIKSKIDVKKVCTVMFIPYIIGWGILCLVGVVGLVLEIVALVIGSSWYSLLVLICCCLVILSSGYLVGVYIYMIVKSRKDGKWSEAECYSDCALFALYGPNGKIAEENIRYDKLAKHVERNDFFALYNNIAVVYAIGKEGMTEDEIDVMRAMLGIKTDGNAAAMPPAYASATAKASETAEPKENEVQSDE